MQEYAKVMVRHETNGNYYNGESNGKEMENEMETGIVLGLYWGYIGIMEKKMETTIVYWGYTRVILGVSWGNVGVILGYIGAFLGQWKVKWKLL